MKKFSKILSVALLVALVLSLGVVNAFADHKITINRDSTWKPTAELKTGETNKATYTYYKIFDAKITSLTSTDAEGNTTEGNVVYTVDTQAKADAINAVADDNGTTLFSAVKGTDGLFYVTLKNSATGAETIVKALKKMVDANTSLFPAGTPVTSDANPVVITVPDGYYLIVASNGNQLAVQTIGDVTITEKNHYPTIDKKQQKADGTWIDDPLPKEIGQYIDYKVTVHVPVDANKTIAVVDKMSSGLEYDKTSFAVDPEVNYSALASGEAGYDSSITDAAKNGWQIKFEYNDYKDHLGDDIVITFKAKVTTAALQDSDKENKVTLNYDNNNYVLWDKVNYEIYATGAVKFNGATVKKDGANYVYTTDGWLDKATGLTEVEYLKNAEFKLQVKNAAGTYVDLPVVLDGTFYRPAVGTETGVVIKSDDNGEIIIRGLEKGKEYQLVETKAPQGFNALTNGVALPLTKDDKANVIIKGTPDDNTTVLKHKEILSGVEMVAKVENNKGTQLPSTGGIGTTIFYAVGGILVLAAIVLLITKKRMSD